MAGTAPCGAAQGATRNVLPQPTWSVFHRSRKDARDVAETKDRLAGKAGSKPALLTSYPNSAMTVRYGGSTVDPEMQRAVFLFFSVFIFFWAAGTLSLSAMGYDFATSASAVVTALSNVGSGIGSMIGPAGNFAGMSDQALTLLSALMLMGRLEIMTVLVVLSPFFWRS